MKKIFITFLFSAIFFLLPLKVHADSTHLTIGTVISEKKYNFVYVPVTPNVYQNDANGTTYCFLYQGDTYTGLSTPVKADGNCWFHEDNAVKQLINNGTTVNARLDYVNNNTQGHLTLGQSDNFILPQNILFSSDCDYHQLNVIGGDGVMEINMLNLCPSSFLGSNTPDSFYFEYTTEQGVQQALPSDYFNQSEYTFAVDNSAGNIVYNAQLVFTCGGVICGSFPIWNNAQGFIILRDPGPGFRGFYGSSISQGNTYQEGSVFYDTLSQQPSSWIVTIDYGDGTGIQQVTTPIGNPQDFPLSHIYSTIGSYPVTVSLTDDLGLTATATAIVSVTTPDVSPTPTETPTPTPVKLTSLSPAKIWIGLKNSDDVGVKFDVKAEVYKDSTLVTSGETDSVAAGSSGFNNAKLDTISFNSFSPIDFPSGSQLKMAVYVRNACTGSGHNSGTARLWYNDSQANSQFGATIGSNTTNYFLGDAFTLLTSAGAGPKKTIDIQSGAKCSAFKPFGTWSITL
ncbi:MAG TPA: PKD domain-containing protein [Candidatus Saccharimonadales bacterium]|nr:PKD domain-containing protein [Candidatus Saccharimonadales bacterium]